MDKEQAIELLKEINLRFWIEKDKVNPLQSILDKRIEKFNKLHNDIDLDTSLSSEEKNHKHDELCKNNPVGSFEAEILYDYIVEKGIININEVKKIDTDKIMLVEDGSVDIDGLEAQGYKVIPYRQGATPPTWLK